MRFSLEMPTENRLRSLFYACFQHVLGREMPRNHGLSPREGQVHGSLGAHTAAAERAPGTGLTQGPAGAARQQLEAL